MGEKARQDFKASIAQLMAAVRLYKLEALKKEILELQGKLDEPNKKYQAFLAAEEIWQKRETALIGTSTDAGSGRGESFAWPGHL